MTALSLALPPLPADPDLLLAEARALQRADAAGRPQLLLRGRNLGLLCEAGSADDAALFHVAALQLGARVAQVSPGLTDATPPQEIRRTARLLGQLYDAVECLGLPSRLVRQLAADAGVPVYDGLASATHPTAALADWLDGGAGLAQRRRYVLQAALCVSIAQAR